MAKKIILQIVRKILRKIEAAYFCLRFQFSFCVFAGKFRFDSAAISRFSLGRYSVLRGSISSFDSSISLGSNCALSAGAEIGAEKNGFIIIGDRVSIGPRCIISTTGETIKIGVGTSFFSDCDISGSVSIGEGCLFARNVTVLSSTHQIYGEGTIRENDALFQRDSSHRQYRHVDIGDDCWLGMNTVILPGVVLGRGVVVGANAVVTKSIPEYSIVGGVPATIIGSRIRKG
jgi:acetyltransferase-like isoleucine patch superfamily enzyme